LFYPLEKPIYRTRVGLQLSNLVIQGRPVEEVQQAVNDGEISLNARYRQGLLLTHLSAVYDRPDVFKWLVNEKGMSLEARDGNGRTVPEVSKQAKVENICDWISRGREMHAISKFLSSNFRRRRAMKQTRHILRCIILIEAVQGGRSVRQVYKSLLVSRLEETVVSKVYGNVQSIPYSASPGSRAAVASAGQS